MPSVSFAVMSKYYALVKDEEATVLCGCWNLTEVLDLFLSGGSLGYIYIRLAVRI